MEGPCYRRRMEAVAQHRSSFRTHGQPLSLTESIPPTPPPPERRRLRGVGKIEPNDEIRQRPAVLLLPPLVAIVSITWIGLNGQGIGWSSHPTCHPSRPTSTPVGPGVWMSMSTTMAQGNPCRGPPVNVGLHRGDKIGRCKTTPHNRWTNIAWILMIKRTCYLHLHYCVLLAPKTIYEENSLEEWIPQNSSYAACRFLFFFCSRLKYSACVQSNRATEIK